MYHSFPASISGQGPATDANRSSEPRRILTSNACTECRRRKIKCDGSQPCQQCQWHDKAHTCKYSEAKKRVVPSRKTVEHLQDQVKQYTFFFARIFPGQKFDALMTLPRNELLKLALTLPAGAPSTPSVPSLLSSSSAVKTEPEHTPSTLGNSQGGAESLAALEQPPEPDDDTQLARTDRSADDVHGISDDVNGLSLSVDNLSSYLGISSVTAAVKVMFKSSPSAQQFTAHISGESALPTRSNTPLLQPGAAQTRPADPSYLPPADVGHKLIESYFANVHALMPMVDEAHLRYTYLYSQRRDSPWLSLLNMVLALGSLASTTCDSTEHILFFQRARIHLDLEGFHRGNLLVLQALGLLGGYYLHWLSRPNEANCLMGAALRMATALGLHREYLDTTAAARPANPSAATSVYVVGGGPVTPAEIRRRTWWTLYSLDTWAHMTTGRPSLGRTCPGITVKIPKIHQAERMNNAQYLHGLVLLPLIHNVTFCKLATKAQDMLASESLIKRSELLALDAELVSWHTDLPPIMRNDLDRPQDHLPPATTTTTTTTTHRDRRESHPQSATSNPGSLPTTSYSPQWDERESGPCPEIIKGPRAIMHWWYQTIRMLMHRPYLLAAALRGTPPNDLSPDEQFAVQKCQAIAGQTIANIDGTHPEGLIGKWAGTWVMYQAVMVPLVSLFYAAAWRGRGEGKNDGRSGAPPLPGALAFSAENIEIWRLQVETAIGYFERVQKWVLSAEKTKEVVERLFAASKFAMEAKGQQQGQRLDLPAELAQAQRLGDEPMHQQQQQHHYQHHHHQQQHQHQQQHPQPPFLPATISPIQTIEHQPPPTSTSTHNNHPFHSNPALHDPTPQNFNHTQGTWGLSPDGDTAMNLLWDDMMWDTIPEMQYPGPDQQSMFFTAGQAYEDWNGFQGGMGDEEGEED